MRALLDTHTFIWWVQDSSSLSQRAREVMLDADNELYVSAVIAWEIAIKTRSGKLTAVDDPVVYVPQQMALDGFIELPVSVAHALRVLHLPLLHRDPFDRLLVAQSQLESLPIITRDPWIARYDVPVIW